MLVHRTSGSLGPRDVPDDHAVVLQDLDGALTWKRRGILVQTVLGGDGADLS